MIREIRTDAGRRELKPHGSARFPFEVNRDDLTSFCGGMVPCHWHAETEFSIVLEGEAVYTLGRGVYRLRAGDGIFINACVPHSFLPCGDSHVRLLTVIAARELIDGGACDESLDSFLQCEALSAVLLDDAEKELLRAAARQEEQQVFAWQLQCRALMCGLFYRLVSRCRAQLRIRRGTSDGDLAKLHTALSYLHTHFDEPLDLDAVANALSMSREGCCRFFKKMTGQTLSQALCDERVLQSLRLLREGNLSITQAALAVGFTNAGRFSAAFAARMGCTPRQFLARDYLIASTEAEKAESCRFSDRY